MAKTKKQTGDSSFSALSDALSKKFGEGAVLQGDQILDTPRITTGSLGLDVATGGGWGRGRIIEIYGPESSGKSTLCILAAVATQQRKEKVAIIDAEHAFDREYAIKLGLDMSEVMISQPDNGEMAFEIALMLVNSGQISLLVIDSVAALVPRVIIEGEMDQSHMGVHARLMSKGLSKLVSAANNTGTTVIFTNQMRDKIGVMFGSPETTTGGNAMKFYASIRVDLRASKGNEKDGERLDSRVTCKVVKNKLAAPFKKCQFTIVYGKGIDRIEEIFELSVLNEVIQQSGSWYSYGETKLGQGQDKIITMLRDNPELVEELEGIVKELYDLK